MNKTINAVIIDDNDDDLACIKESLVKDKNVNIINTFKDGMDALKYITSNQNKIDLIIMELLLPSLDGLSLIEKLIDSNINKDVIITSSYKEVRIIKDLAKYNIIGYFVKPFSMSAVVKKIDSLVEDNISFTDNIDLKISEILHNLGIPSHIRGYKYIRDGIAMMYNNDTIALITKEIYPQIAYKYETTPSRVERAIRHAIEVSWVRGDIGLMDEFFGFSISCDKSKPTNSEFLSTIADRLKILNKATA
jgi:two-component system response regulator (stage 0 sporulation protein A)